MRCAHEKTEDRAFIRRELGNLLALILGVGLAAVLLFLAGIGCYIVTENSRAETQPVTQTGCFIHNEQPRR